MTIDEFVSVKEAAQILRYHRNHVYRLLREGKLEGKKFGGGWVVSVESVARIKSRQGDHGRVNW